MARQQYNNRSITSYGQVGRKHTGGFQPVKKLTWNSSTLPGSRNSPRNSPPRYERSGGQLRDALVEWLVNELDSWFYAAMRLEQASYSKYCISIYKKEPNGGLRYQSIIGFIMLEEDRAKITLSNPARQRRAGFQQDGEGANCVPVLYADPDMFDLIQDAIRLIYNNG